VNAETIPALLALRGADCPQREAIVDDIARITYAELDRRSARRAAWLVANGVNKGHRVALSMPNGIEWAINACAVLRIGAVLVPLSTLLRTPELCAQLAVAGVRHLIATPMFRGRDYRGELTAIERTTLPSLCNLWWADALGDGGRDAEQAVATELEVSVRPADDMVVVFTSGSSGPPKGVIHTHGGALRANAAGLDDRCVRAGTRLYLPMPFFWVGGLAAGLVSALNAGATLLTEAAPDPGKTLQFLQRERATLFRGWPDQAVALASHPDFANTDLTSLTPGSLEALLPVALRGGPGSRANVFGMTETFGPFCGYALDRGMPQDKWGSCGRPFAGMQVRVVDADSGAPLPAGTVGAIQVGGRNILRGICGREREEVFTPDGWYDGGDLGWLDADSFLYYTGRRDDRVKINGATVYPSEVVAALETIPGIRRAFATDIDLDGANAIGAVVVSATPDTIIDIDDLRRAARERLSAFKVPSRWIIVASLQDIPHTATGKIDKPALRARLQSVTH
jgi:acyl-CoA synthetase (AMP-forming)/AMP-acid ligase II